jgi:phage terminase large subunit GpA-like protein
MGCLASKPTTAGNQVTGVGKNATDGGADRVQTCDKCDSLDHLTDNCPHFAMGREAEPADGIGYDDATRIFSFPCPHCGDVAQVASCVERGSSSVSLLPFFFKRN